MLENCERYAAFDGGLTQSQLEKGEAFSWGRSRAC